MNTNEWEGKFVNLRVLDGHLEMISTIYGKEKIWEDVCSGKVKKQPPDLTAGEHDR